MPTRGAHQVVQTVRGQRSGPKWSTCSSGGTSRRARSLFNRHDSLLKTGRIAESLAEHQAIMAALLARDTQRTQERMREHFANGLEAAE